MEEQEKRVLSLQQRRMLIEKNKKKQALQDISCVCRKPGENIFPASFSQRRIWFMYQLKPNSIEYNVPEAYIIKGKFSLVHCREAFDEIVSRHEVLRTTFREIEGEPMQVVHPHKKSAFEYLDFSPMEEGKEKDLIIDQEVKKATNCIFDLEKGPLIQFLLIKKQENIHILVIVAHHSVIDSWSLSILRREFQVIYQSKCQSKDVIPLAPLKVQYGDFALWQQKNMTSKKLSKQLDYWVSKLKDYIEDIKLPTDFNRPPIRTARGAAHSFNSSPQLAKQIKKLASENDCTTFMVLLSAFQILLYHYTHQERIVVGTTASSRPTPETEEIIGFFINNLTFNTYIGDKPSFKDYLLRVKDETLAMYKNQEVPFEKVVEALHLKRDLSRTAIYQVMFNYLSAAGDHSEMKELNSQMYGLGGSKATTDLNLFAWEEEDSIHFNFEYCTDLFRESTIQRLGQHYITLLNSIVEDSTRTIDKMPLLTSIERECLLSRGKRQMISVDSSIVIHRLFEEQVNKAPKHTAVYFEGKEVSYEELNQNANKVAHYLLDLGITPGTKIGLFMDRSIEMIIAMLGVLKAGGAYVPLDPTYPANRISSIIERARTRHILTQRHLLASFPEMDKIQLVGIDTLLEGNNGMKNPDLELSGEALMYILFTSGSTGEPKGVMIKHRNYVSYIKAITKRLEMNEPLSFAIVTTFAADLGSFNIFAPLLTGGCVHVIAYERATDPDWLAAYFKVHPIDVIKMVPSHYEALQVGKDAKSIVPRKMIIFAGETLRQEIPKKVWEYNPNCRVFNNYGPTETTVSVLAYEVKKDKVREGYPIPLGTPLENSYVYVLDENKQLVPFGVIGELYIGGEGVSEGYLEREDLTRERFLYDPFDSEGKRKLYKSGDLVRCLEDGSIEFVGRADRQIKIRGYRVELGAIERVTQEHEAVQEAIAQVATEKDGSSRLIVYITLHKELLTFNTTVLRKYLKNKLPDYMVPNSFVVLKSIPINANGKIDYKALPIPDRSQEESEAYVAPRNEWEEKLATIWCEVLGIKKVGIDDNFFDLGGESFKAIKITRKIGKNVSVIDLFKFPTIRELSHRLLGEVQEEEGRLIKLTPNTQKNILMNYICFPFAAGSAISFQPLANELPENCALYGVRMPGRDFSKPEDIGGTIESIVHECVTEIQEKVQGPISIYAQCIAGAWGLLLAYELRKQGIKVVTLFEAANFPSPRLPGKISEWWSKLFPADRWMSNRVYRETLRSLGNEDDMGNVEEENFLIAGIRHEVRLGEDFFSKTYYDSTFEKVDVPICCIIGEQDRSTEYYQERYHEWERYSDQVSLNVIKEAGHFFQKHQPKQLCGIMTEKIMQYMEDERLLVVKNKKEEKTSFELIEGGKKSIKDEGSMKLFFIIILGQVISILGSNLSSFATGIWIYNQTGSIGNFSAISVCALVPSIIFAPLAGVVADYYDKRKIMILGDLCSVLGTLLVLVMYSLGRLEVWHICLAVVVSSTGGAFQSPAFLSAIPILVPKRYLGQANGILQFVTSGGQMLGPILGAGALYLLGMKGVLFMDFITCFATVGTLLCIKFPNRSFKKREEPFIKELIGGWYYIMKRYSLVVMVAFFVVANFLMSLVTVLFTPLAIALSTVKGLGFVLGANAAGVVLGSIIMSLWGGTKRRANGMVGFLILSGVSIIIMGIRPSALLLGIGLFLFGISIAFVDTHWQIMIQTKVGLELQGRVFSINQMLVSVFRPMAFLLAAPLCEKIFEPMMMSKSPIVESIKLIIGTGDTRGMGLLFVSVGLVLFIWSILGFNYKPLRNMEDYLPDAIPGPVIYKDKDKIQASIDRAVS
ncbi:non-ribosomal peptide synthetase [Sporanaerobium hydrogeniformans]|uniref:Non-ribosomal peptide synthetase n=1 Tax=Sporanaerobium hydrogeniformans TaxID=3072179 RepID=A0AC61DCU3_9FIRM|nr:non-ribosomal peptide synthetase/MFS transporter [Sporanaerobium hydrogeniformans]PHV70431.1 non-ribosomal peptide synthetase [Sporanaerobium hydrogeniformans]